MKRAAKNPKLAYARKMIAKANKEMDDKRFNFSQKELLATQDPADLAKGVINIDRVLEQQPLLQWNAKEKLKKAKESI